MAALGLALVPAVKATSGYDLIAGFTTGSGSDDLLDLGPAINVPQYSETGFYNGEQWDLTTEFPSLNPNSVSWGVIGDAATSIDGASVNTLFTTTGGSTPPAIGSDTFFGNADSGINALEVEDFGGGSAGYQSVAGNFTTVSASSENSWNEQTISGSLGTQFVNAYINPNVSGETPDTLWEVPEGSAPIDLGTFTLSSNAGQTYLTFDAVPEPGTWALLSTAGLMALIWRYRFQRRQA